MLAIIIPLVFSVTLAQNDMTLVKLPNGVAEGAKCLDGSPLAYYIRRNTTSPNWVVFFEGGGWCYTLEECYERSLTSLGSSNSYAATSSSNSIYSNSKTINPDFYEWNAVYLPYCDGASWTGNNAEAVNYEGHLLYFRGHVNLEYMFYSLAEIGMASAENILVSGCSAGGLSTYQHSDFVSQAFSKATVKAAAISGYFLYIKNLQGTREYTIEMESVFSMQNSSSGVHQGCLAANPDHPNYCIFAPFVYPHIQTPFFVLNSMYDTWQLQCILTAQDGTGTCNSDPSWSECVSGKPADCNATQVDYLNSNFRAEMLDLMQNTPTYQNPNNGAFLDSCLGHCETEGAWNTIGIGGITVQQAVGDWYFQRVSNHKYVDCTITTTQPVACNPTCGQGDEERFTPAW